MDNTHLFVFNNKLKKIKQDFRNKYISICKDSIIKNRNKYYFDYDFLLLESNYLLLIEQKLLSQTEELYKRNDELEENDFKEIKIKSTTQLHNDFSILYLEYNQEIKPLFETYNYYVKDIDKQMKVILQKIEKII